MNNKLNLKKTIDSDFDKEKNYLNIVRKKESRRGMNKYFKYALVSVILIALITTGITFMGKKDKELMTDNPIKENNKDIIKINDVSNYIQGALRYDADVQIINYINIPYYEEFNGMKIPSDIELDKMYAISFKKDKDSDYILNNYVYQYYDSKYERKISIAFSKENKPIRDYYFTEEASQISIINNVELKVFKYNELYFTEFNYKEINFDIETANITEKELTDLLASIIK